MNKSFFCLSQSKRSAILRGIAVAFVTFVFGGRAVCGEIHDAARIGGVEWAARLIKADPKLVFSKDKSGWTPLHCAVQEGHTNVVELLLSNKADVNAKDNIGWTPLHVAVADGQKDALGVVKLLLDNKADVNARSKDGNTPLHLAASAGRKDLGELLLHDKADVNARNKCGVTPLHIAVCADNEEMAELLRQHGGHQ